MLEMARSGRDTDLRNAVTLCGLSVVWNALAGSAAVAIGLASHSLSLAGFGLNAAVDSIASAALIWRFGVEGRDPSRAAAAERSALRIVGLTLLAIASYIAVRAVVALVAGSGPDSSAGALAVAIGSVVVLSPLAYGKWRLARRLDSRALRGDGILSGVGALLALIALLGLGLSSVDRWWWVDSLGALLVSAVLSHEGVAALRRLEP
jgi:divalent metal cation (Fe/Co/Zn/Cd) transporter